MKEIKLQGNQIKRAECLMRKVFAEHTDKDVNTVTDIYVLQLLNYLGYTITDDELNDELIYQVLDIIGARKQTRETYQTLTYHFNLYKKGVTNLRCFLRVCNYK